MKANVSGPLAVVIILVVLGVAAAIGWHFMNRELKPINPGVPPPGSTSAGGKAGGVTSALN